MAASGTTAGTPARTNTTATTGIPTIWQQANKRKDANKSRDDSNTRDTNNMGSKPTTAGTSTRAKTTATAGTPTIWQQANNSRDANKSRGTTATARRRKRYFRSRRSSAAVGTAATAGL